jgi:hypothetical protein
VGQLLELQWQLLGNQRVVVRRTAMLAGICLLFVIMNPNYTYYKLQLIIIIIIIYLKTGYSLNSALVGWTVTLMFRHNVMYLDL